MKTHSGWWLLLAVALVGGPVAWADVVKLKDGTTVEGEIISETDTEMVLEKHFAGGGSARQTITKADVADVLRDPPAEKARKAMERAYEITKRFRLDPKVGFALERYDQVLNGTLRKFLTDYPDSPHTAEVAGKVAEWEAERTRVAGGEVKVDGRWLSSQEAKDLQAQASIRQARQLMAVERFAEAAQRLEQAEPTAPVRDELRECYRVWHQWLAVRKKTLETEIAGLEPRVAQARQNVGQIKSKPVAIGKISAKDNKNLEPDTLGTFGTESAAKSESAALEFQLAQLRSQLAETQRGLVVVEGRALAAGVDPLVVTGKETPNNASVVAGKETPNNAPVTGASGPATKESPAGEEEDVLTALVRWFKGYWLWAVVILVVVIWYVSNRLGR